MLGTHAHVFPYLGHLNSDVMVVDVRCALGRAQGGKGQSR